MAADQPGPSLEAEHGTTSARRRFWLARAVRWLAGSDAGDDLRGGHLPAGVLLPTRAARRAAARRGDHLPAGAVRGGRARCFRQISAAVRVFSFVGMWILRPTPVLYLGEISMGAALVYGYNVRVRRQAQRQVVEAEQRTADERAARAVLAERSRIARELHDVV